MTIEREIGNELKVYCDGCSEYLLGDEDFYSTLEMIKSEGWKSVKNGKDWEHFCPQCQTNRKMEVPKNGT